MTDPVSAVLEYPDVAMVTIVDPEDGMNDSFGVNVQFWSKCLQKISI